MTTGIKFDTSAGAVMVEEFTSGKVRHVVGGLRAPCNQVGSYYPQRENFRLTPEVKEKFTEKSKV
jgi:phosphoglucomutase